MTHWSVIASVENGTPYVLAGIDRLWLDRSRSGKVYRSWLANKLCVLPDRNLVIVGTGNVSVLDAVRYKMLQTAKSDASMMEILAAGARTFGTAYCTGQQQWSAGNVIAVARINGQGPEIGVIEDNCVEAYVRWFTYGMAIASNDPFNGRNVDCENIPSADALDAIVSANEAAHVKYPDKVSREHDILLLTRGSLPTELFVDYEWGKPVVRRAEPIRKTIVPWA